MLLTTYRHHTGIFFYLIYFSFSFWLIIVEITYFFTSFNLVLLIKVLPMKKACILFSWMYFSGHVSITSHSRKCIGFNQCKMFRDAGNLFLMEHSCFCCLIICANNFQNNFGRLFYRFIHMPVIGSTIPFLHSWHFKKSTLLLWIWHAVKVSLLIATKLLSSPRDKLKCLQLQLKRQLFSKICQISANLELFSMCMDVSVWSNHWFCVFYIWQYALTKKWMIFDFFFSWIVDVLHQMS